MIKKKSQKTHKNPQGGEYDFRLLFANHPVPMWVYDLQTLAFLDVNDAALEKYGHTRSEFLALTIKDIRPTEDIASLMNNLEQKRRPLQHSGEWHHRLKNGQVIDVEITSHTLEFEGRKAVLVMAQDITDRKRAEAAMLENKLTAERYLNIAAEIIVSLDREGNITLLNESGHQLLGYDTMELIGKNWFDTCSPEEERNEVRRFFEMLEKGEVGVTETHENSVLTKSGERKIILWHNTALRDHSNRFMGTLSSGEDITARMEMEKALRIALAKYKTLFECFPLGITFTDESGNILETNPIAEKLLAVSRDEHAQRKINDSEWHIIRSDGTPMPPDEFASVQALKERRMVQNAEMGIVKPDHSTTWLSVTATPLPFEGHGVVIAYSDITARKRTEDALKARVRLSQFAESHTLDELLQKTLDEAEILTGSQIGFAHFLEADQKTLNLQTWSTNTLKNMCTAEGQGQHYTVDQAGVWVDCIYARAPVIHNDYASLPASRRKGLPQGHVPVIRELVVPVLHGDLIVAIFGVGNKAGDYTRDDVEVVVQLANLTWDIVQRKQAEEELQNAKNALEKINQELQSSLIREKQLAHTDMLTGVNNRRYLYELATREFEIALRYHRPLSMMLFDLDHFKKVNDTFGHTVGDQILTQVTQAACAELRSADAIGRYGGEEFVILLPMTNAQQAYPLAERIRKSVAALRVPTPMGDAAVTLSIGIVELMQARAHSESVDDMIRHADQAMYAAKQAGRNHTLIFDQS